MDLNDSPHSKGLRNLDLVINKDLLSCAPSSYSVRRHKNEAREMSPQASPEPTHFSGTILTWENWDTEKSNLEHRSEIEYYFIEQNTDAQERWCKPVCGHTSSEVTLRTSFCTRVPQWSSQFQLCKKNPQSCPPCSPTIRPPLSSPGLGLYLAAAFFPVCKWRT